MYISLYFRQYDEVEEKQAGGRYACPALTCTVMPEKIFLMSESVIKKEKYSKLHKFVAYIVN